MGLLEELQLMQSLPGVRAKSRFGFPTLEMTPPPNPGEQYPSPLQNPYQDALLPTTRPTPMTANTPPTPIPAPPFARPWESSFPAYETEPLGQVDASIGGKSYDYAGSQSRHAGSVGPTFRGAVEEVGKGSPFYAPPSSKMSGSFSAASISGTTPMADQLRDEEYSRALKSAGAENQLAQLQAQTRQASMTPEQQADIKDQGAVRLLEKVIGSKEQYTARKVQEAATAVQQTPQFMAAPPEQRQMMINAARVAASGDALDEYLKMMVTLSVKRWDTGGYGL